MDGATREFIKKMRADGTPLTTFQLKSLTVTPFSVMDDVTKMTEFSWECCESNPCTDRNHKTGRDQAVKIVVGRDAVHPPWNLLAPRIDHLKTQTTTVAMAGTSTLAPSIASNCGEKRRRPDSGVFSMEPSITPAPLKCSKRQKFDDVNLNDDSSDATYEDPSGAIDQDPRTRDTTALSFVQQVRAQATRVNTSVVVLHSGNHEVIGIRHRSSQTLYVSDVNIPYQCVNPGYGKIHVGIIIAAV